MDSFSESKLVTKGWWGINKNQCINFGEIHQEGMVLILEFFEVAELSAIHEKSFFDTIWGYNNKGEKVSLFNCFKLSTKLSSITSFAFFISYIVIGEHLDNIKHIKTNKLTCNLNNLLIWLVGRKNIKQKVKQHSIEFEYEKPTSITHKINKNKRIIYSFKYNVREGIYTRNIGINTEALFNWRTHTEQSLVSILSNLKSFQNFLTFLFLSPVYPNDIEIFISKGRKKLRVLFPSEKLSNVREVTNLFEILLIQSELEARSPSYFSNWLSTEKSFAESLNLFLETIYNPFLPKEKVLFNLVTALESYHRYAYNRRKISLFDRLIDFHSNYMEAYNSVTRITRANAFFQKIVDTRNYHAHILPQKEKKRFKGVSLLNAIRKTKMMNIAWILTRIGLSNKEVKEILKNRIIDGKLPKINFKNK